MSRDKIHSNSSISQCRIIAIESHRHHNGALCVVDNEAEILPFTVKRVFYIYDVPAHSERGGHSHFEMAEFIVAVSGSFDVTVDDGANTHKFTLNSPDCGLYVPPGIWRTLDNFSSGSVCLAMCPTLFEESDYVRDYNDFLKLTECKRQ